MCVRCLYFPLPSPLLSFLSLPPLPFILSLLPLSYSPHPHSFLSRIFFLSPLSRLYPFPRLSSPLPFFITPPLSPPPPFLITHSPYAPSLPPLSSLLFIQNPLPLSFITPLSPPRLSSPPLPYHSLPLCPFPSPPPSPTSAIRALKTKGQPGGREEYQGEGGYHGGRGEYHEGRGGEYYGGRGGGVPKGRRRQCSCLVECVFVLLVCVCLCVDIM